MHSPVCYKKSITLKAHAKINPTIEIKGLSDGILGLDMTWQCVDIHDIVKITLEPINSEKSTRIIIDSNNSLVPSGRAAQKNNCWQATHDFFSAADKKGISSSFKVIIYIDKKLPLGGGLGGSSTDVAAVLKGLNILFDYPFNDTEIMNIGTLSGHDNAFFCCPWSAARGSEKRDNRVELKQIKNLQNIVIIAVMPNFEISAAQVYKDIVSAYKGTFKIESLKGITERFEMLLKKAALINLTCPDQSELMDTALKIMNNQLETAQIIKQNKVYSELSKLMYQAGAVNTILSGSGSTFLGIWSENKFSKIIETKIFEQILLKFPAFRIQRLLISDKMPVYEIACP